MHCSLGVTTGSYHEIMGDYLPHQRYELPTNKWEEEYQGGYDLPKVNDIDGIHMGGNDESYDEYIRAEVQLPDVSGNSLLGRLLNTRKGIKGEIIGSFHTNSFINTQEYEVEFSNGSYHELTSNQIHVLITKVTTYIY